MTAIAAPLVTDQERKGRYLGWAGVVIAIVAALLRSRRSRSAPSCRPRSSSRHRSRAVSRRCAAA